VPLSVRAGAGSPSNIMSLGLRPVSVASGILIHPPVWPQQTWAEKCGAVVPFLGELGPHLTQCRLGRSLPPYQVASLMHPAVWPQQTLAENWGAGCAPFWGREWVPIYNNVAWAEAYLHTKWHPNLSNRLTTVHQRYRQTDRQDRQRSDNIGRTVLQTVAQKRKNLGKNNTNVCKGAQKRMPLCIMLHLLARCLIICLALYNSENFAVIISICDS